MDGSQFRLVRWNNFSSTSTPSRALSPPPSYLKTALRSTSKPSVPYLNFTPGVAIGRGFRQILLNKSVWQQLWENQGVIPNYIHSDKLSNNSITNGNINIYFEAVGKHPVIKLEDPSKQFVTLGVKDFAN